jgi:single-stranded DNA-binding protein
MNYTLRNTDAEIRVRGRVGNLRKNEGSNGGQKVSNFSVAFTRSWKKKDESGNDTAEFDHRTAWIEAAAWGPNADRAANIGVGDVVEVTGSLADLGTSVYEKDGATKASLKLQRATVLLIAKKEDGDAPADEPIEAPLAEEAI